jgi:drug/metabolite transporter (DMT)-like permease
VDPRAIALVVVAALFHAGWNLALHRHGGERLAAMAVASLTGGAVLIPALVLAFPVHALGFAALSAAGETAYAVALSSSYARGDLSVAYPIGRGTSPFLITLGGIAVLGQAPSITAVAGAVALAAGLVLVATQERAGRDAVAMALLVGVCITSYSVVDARAVQHTNPLGYLSLVLLVAGIAQAGLVRFDIGRLRAAAPTGVLIGLGALGSYILVLFAFTLAPAGRVSTVREVAVLFGMAAARERPGGRAWVGAALVVAGAVLAGL